MESIFVFGTCRVYNPLKYSTNYIVNKFPNYIDTTSEIIQFIKLNKNYNNNIQKYIYDKVIDDTIFDMIYKQFITANILVIDYDNNIIDEKELEQDLLF